MKKLFVFPLLIAAVLMMNSCIAMKEDVKKDIEIAKAETFAKLKLMEEDFEKKTTASMQEEIAKMNAKIDELEKSQQNEKQMQKNKIDLSFSNLEELRATITELNNRIDSVDLTAQKSTALNEQLAALEKKLAENEQELALLKENIDRQIEGLKPVENFTVTKDGAIRLPESETKSYNQLVDYTKSENCDSAVARKAWETYAQKWPESRKCDVEYWIGETYFQEKSYNKTIETLQPIEKKYPGCVKIESSYLKIAFSLFYIEKYEVSAAILESMKEKFPQSAFPDKVKELEKLLDEKLPKKKAAPAKQAPAKKQEPAKKTPAKKSK